jgi:hypothetical protein
MLRGSRPGERRGGRTQGTPNQRTILRDRILSIGLDHPAASQRAFLLKLVKDRKLPADTRMARQSERGRFGRPGHERWPAAGPPLRKRVSPQRALRWLRACKRPQWLRPSETGILRCSTPCLALSRMPRQIPKRGEKRRLKIAEFLLPKAGRHPPDRYRGCESVRRAMALFRARCCKCSILDAVAHYSVLPVQF